MKDTVSVSLEFLISTNRSDQKIFRISLFVQPLPASSAEAIEKFGLDGLKKHWDFSDLFTALSYYQDLSDAWEIPTHSQEHSLTKICTELVSIGVLRGEIPDEPFFSIQKIMDSFFPNKHSIIKKEPMINKSSMFLEILKLLEEKLRTPVPEQMLVDKLVESEKFSEDEALMYIRRTKNEASIYESKPGCYNSV